MPVAMPGHASMLQVPFAHLEFKKQTRKQRFYSPQIESAIGENKLSCTTIECAICSMALKGSTVQTTYML